jgi:hypothetical protein
MQEISPQHDFVFLLLDNRQSITSNQPSPDDLKFAFVAGARAAGHAFRAVFDIGDKALFY